MNTEAPRSDTVRPRRLLAIAAVGSLLAWLAFPPVGWWWLAPIAPVAWLWPIVDSSPLSRRGYAALWLGSCVFWLPYLHGLRLAHPALYLGWISLSLYLAVYLPLFVGLTRTAVHQLRVPLVVAAPVLWTGLELARAYMLTGFSGGMLGHALFAQPLLIQFADVAGAYGVTAGVVLTAACLLQIVRGAADGRIGGGASGGDRGGDGKGDDKGDGGGNGAGGKVARGDMGAVVIHAAVLVAIVLATAAYGRMRLATSTQAPEPEPAKAAGVRVGLVQESVDVVFEFNEERNRQTFDKYRRATLELCRREPGLDLVVWPESMFTENSPEFVIDQLELRERAGRAIAEFEAKVQRLAREVNSVAPAADAEGTEKAKDATDARSEARRKTWLLVGSVTIDFTGAPADAFRADNGFQPREYNTALLISPEGRIAGRYHKTHLVMFGEYVPFSWLAPNLVRGLGLPVSLDEGPGPVGMTLSDVRFSPSICFESMVPQVIHRQMKSLGDRGEAPDVLVNLTNDGWFWGSSVLDMHFQSAVFRAIESRRSVLIAANTGFSAWVDRDGRILARSQRRSAATLVAEVGRNDEKSIYQSWGDLPAKLCFMAGAVCAVVGYVHRRRHKPADRSKPTATRA